MIAGVSDYFTPTVFGGSKNRAIYALDRAIEHYTEDSGSGYHWGHAEAYVWRGLVYMELGEAEKAMQDWQTALRIEPEFYWADFLLEKNQ